MGKDIWVVHGNWTATGMNAVHTQKGKKVVSKYFNSVDSAKKYAIKKAKKEGLKKYGYENSSGIWSDKKIIATKKPTPKRRRTTTSPFGRSIRANPFGIKAPRF